MIAPDKAAPPSNALPAGYRLGEYAVVAVLGQGGFGITYRARDTKLGVDVAIKEYFPSIYVARTRASTIQLRPGADRESYQWGLAEFLKEAQALALFKHPHIVRVLRFMEANGTAYMIMEYEQGETLVAHLRRHGGVLGEATLLQLFLPVLNGLQAVHDAGLLHLDIKPDNIYLRADGQPMLIDFGSSRQARSSASAKVALTPGFCALEQYPGYGDVGPSSDVYGMAATIYRCITGKNPLDALARHQAFERTRIDPLPPAASFTRPVYSAHIRPCIDAALKLAANERPASAHALQQGLMGKDMAKAAARAPTSLYRPGTGFIGVVLPPEQKKEQRRRYTGFEKFLAITVFVATFAVITPKIMIDTGYLTDTEAHEAVDDAQTRIVAAAEDIGAWINEHVFREPPKPKVTRTLSIPRARSAPEPIVIAETLPPFGVERQEPARLVLGDEIPRAIGFLQHGAVLALVADNGTVHLWDVQTGERRTTVTARVARPEALAVFPNSQWFAASNHEDAITVFDPLGNLETTLRNDPPRPVSTMAVSTNALLLAETGDDGTINLWGLAQQRKARNLDAGRSAVRALAFAPDDRRLASGNAAGEIGLWDVAEGKRLSQWRAHESGVAVIAFAPDARHLASVGADGDIRLWSLVPTTGEWAPAATPANAPVAVNSVSFSPDSRWLLATGSVGSIYVWAIDTGTLAHRLNTDARKLHGLTLTRDGRFIAAVGDDHAVRLWR